ncbi:MAG: response regulator transcription factor [Alphaproteobacteria bacterium]|nr:response regulator transcription factor [Alphaproteobacteria bacterium]
MTDEKPHILVVDDDQRLRKLLATYLDEQGFMVSTADGAEKALEVLSIFIPDLIILDLMMPKISGLELLETLRQGGSQTPVIMLTAMGETADRIKGLETGADDYVPKPFEPKELCLRITSVLKRSKLQPAAKTKAQFGSFVYDFGLRELSKDGRKISLSMTERATLETLIASLGEPVSREKLAIATNTENNPRAVDVQITRLRKRLDDPHIIQSVRAKGYALRVQ